jgi:hypothetical protein
MRERSRQTWWITGLGWLLFGSCQSTLAPYPDDLLLLGKKPVAGKVGRSGPHGVGWSEPSPPLLAPSLDGSATTQPDSALDPKISITDLRPAPRSGETKTVVRVSKMPLSGNRLSLNHGIKETAELPPFRQLVPETYGCAPDYSWLQGTLTTTAEGFSLLRYCLEEKNDHLGGKVLLDSDPRLARFRDGDVILVEGQLARPVGRDIAAGYRIRDIWLAKRH